MVAAALASQVTLGRSMVPPFSQGSVCQAVCKLFPDRVFEGFQFLMVEDLINADPFLTYSRWLSEQELAWDGALAPQLPSQQVRHWQRTSDGKQVGAISHEAALPPLLSFGLSPIPTLARRWRGPSSRPRLSRCPCWILTSPSQPTSPLLTGASCTRSARTSWVG